MIIAAVLQDSAREIIISDKCRGYLKRDSQLYHLLFRMTTPYFENFSETLRKSKVNVGGIFFVCIHYVVCAVGS